MSIRTLFRLLTAFAFVAAGEVAAVQRTFVASYGLPGNTVFNCSIAKPCRAFGDALGVTSPNGEIIVLDSAGYGTVTLTKSVAIIAPPGVYAGVSVPAGSDGITVNAPGATVVVRGLSVNGQGGRWGVYMQSAARLRIEGCVIANMAQDGVNHSANGGELVMLDTIVRDNGNFGINVVADTSVVLDHVRSEHNQGSGLGIVPTSTEASATVTDSIFSNNVGSGVVADANSGTHTRILLERTTLSNNGGPGFFGTTGHPASFVDATLTRNAINRNVGAGILLSAFTVPLVQARVSENAVQGNLAGGVVLLAGASAHVVANTIGASFGDADMACYSGSTLYSLGNNSAANVDEHLASCYFKIPGL